MPATETLPRLLTTGRMAEILGANRDRVARVLATRPHIRARTLAGKTRLYDQDALAQVRYELNLVDARQATGGGRA